MTEDDPITTALTNPAHPIWKVIILCVLILGGGSVVGVDVVNTAGF